MTTIDVPDVARELGERFTQAGFQVELYPYYDPASVKSRDRALFAGGR